MVAAMSRYFGHPGPTVELVRSNGRVKVWIAVSLVVYLRIGQDNFDQLARSFRDLAHTVPTLKVQP